MFTVGKYNRHLKNYLENPDLDQIDLRLLRGFYSKKSKEIEADYKGALKTPSESNGDLTLRRNIGWGTTPKYPIRKRFVFSTGMRPMHRTRTAISNDHQLPDEDQPQRLNTAQVANLNVGYITNPEQEVSDLLDQDAPLSNSPDPTLLSHNTSSIV